MLITRDGRVVEIFTESLSRRTVENGKSFAFLNNVFSWPKEDLFS
jgi:hypothetical protein